MNRICGCGHTDGTHNTFGRCTAPGCGCMKVTAYGPRCICGHEERSHILIAKRDQSNKRCTECNDCEGYMQSAVETVVKEWAEEAHRKMYEQTTGPVTGTKMRGPKPKEIIKKHVSIMNKLIGEKTMEEGKKFDGDKLRLDLIPTILLRGVAWILTFGAKKYGDRNWEQGILYHRVWGALLRHLMAWYDGETNDPESGKPHLWHAACNLSFLMHFEDNRDRYESFDDRPSQADRPFNS